MSKFFNMILKLKRNSVFWMRLSLLFLVSNAILLYLFLMNNNPLPNHSGSEYPLVDFSRNFIPQEDFIVNIQPLREKLRKITNEIATDKITVYVEFLNTGANISINQETKLLPASFPKLPLSMIAQRKIQNGEWKFDDMLVLTPDDIDENWGSLYERGVGTTFTIEELIEEMLVNSDNTAYNIVLRNVSESDLSSIIDDLGLEKLFTSDGRVSAKEYTRILRSLYASSYLNRENSQKILTLMTKSPYSEYLQKGIAPEVPFAHKIGENREQDVYADSGIVYLPNRPYLITVMVKLTAGDGGRDRALSIMSEISRETFNYFSTK